MEKNVIEVLVNSKTVAKVENGNKIVRLTYKAIRDAVEKLGNDSVLYFNNYINSKDVEGAFAKLQDNNLLLCIQWACKQGGLIVVYDIESKTIIHLSDGAYVNDVNLDGDELIVEEEVDNFVKHGAKVIKYHKLGDWNHYKEIK